MRRLLVLAALLVALPAGAVTMDWVYVGNPGNTPDTSANCFALNCGSVGFAYYVSKYEVTNAQYAEFLNAKAAAEPNELYSAHMAGDSERITRNGGPYCFNGSKAGADASL